MIRSALVDDDPAHGGRHARVEVIRERRKSVRGHAVECSIGCLLVLALLDSGTVRAQVSEDFLVVDCLLPPQIRQLGQRTTFLSGRRPIKTSASDCGIRGGEYVAYDRADYATALRVWLPLAQQGDSEASANVGEIYEKGLGLMPDYGTAAEWYRRAAETGNVRAQINLGHLYEKGLGVDRDPLQALEWYRRASGLDEEIQLLPAELGSGAAVELDTLRREVDILRAESESLRRSLDAAQDEIGALEQSLDDAATPETSQSTPGPSAQASLNDVLNALNGEIDQRTDEAERLAEQIRAMRGELSATTGELEESRRALDREREIYEQARAELVEVEGERAERQRELDELRDSIAGEQSLLDERESALAARRDLLERLDEQVAALETSAAERREEIAALQTQQSAMLDRVLAGPEITLIDPQVLTTRAIVPVAAVEVGSSRQIVGQVEAPAGLLSLSVNGERVDANPLGVFTTTLAVGASESAVSIIAVDQQGKRAELKFTLQPPAPRAAGEGVRSADSARRSAVPDVDFGEYHALVIGNDEYTDLPRLRTAVNDARELASILENRYGFKTRTLANATRYEILSALNDYREELTSEDNLLIYYAGHGELDEANARGHWLPVDAERDSTANWISNVAVTDILNVMSAKQILVVVDSCYSGSLTRSSVGRLEVGLTEDERTHWLRTMAEKRARMVLTSGGLAPVLDSGGGEHSVFAKALLEVLGTNEELIDGQRLYQALAARVSYAASNLRFDQVPEYAPIRFAGHEAGDFFFVPAL